MTNKELWDSVLVEMELNLSKANFSTWFKDTSIEKIKDGVVYIATPNNFARDWLNDKFHNQIFNIIREKTTDPIRNVEYIIGSSKKPPTINPSLKMEANKLPLGNLYVNKDTNLNPRYTFENFIIGSFNELAYAAAQAVVKNPGHIYNPLYVYGNTGHGKTHLIQAVGNEINKLYPEKNIYYLTSERFSVEFVNAVKSNKITNFKAKYQKYDILIMDDIQFLANKEKSQEELFHLFNAMYDQNKQIVFSSDKHPNYIQNLEDRLKSRFSAGMVIDIPAPDYESRQAIIKSKLQQTGVNLDESLIKFITENTSSNVRELEGIVNNLSLQNQLEKKITITDLKKILKETKRPQKTISIKELVSIVAEYYEIDPNSIYTKSRKKEIVKPRQLTMYILRNDFNVSFPTIGQKIGGRDHTTVMHSCSKIEKDMETNPNLMKELEYIRTMIA